MRRSRSIDWVRTLAHGRLPARQAIPVALALVLAAVLIRLPLQPVIGSTIPLATFFPAVLLAAVLGGIGIAVGTALLSFAVVWWWLLPEAGSFAGDAPRILATAIFFGSVSAINVALVALLRRAATEADTLAQSVAEGRERLSRALRAGGLGSYDYDFVTGEVNWDEGAYRLWGLGRDQDVTLGIVRSRVDPRDLPAFDADIEASISGANGGYRDITYRLLDETGAVARWVHVQAQVTYDESGAPARMVGTIRDVSERMEAEEAAASMRRQIDGALAAGGVGTFRWDGSAERITWDDIALGLWGDDAESLVGTESVRARIHPDDLAAFDASLARALDPAGDGRRSITYRLLDGNGAFHRWIAAESQTTFEDGRPVSATGTLRDVTALKQAEEARELLVRELNHRVKNLFAVVNAIVSLTARGRDDVEGLVADIRSRIGALARAQSLSIDEGSDGTVTLYDLAEAVLAPLSDGRHRLSGDAVALPAGVLTPMGLALHELATNAAKYGALQGSDGTMDLSWRRDGARLHLTWHEPGVVPAEAPGAEGGFGGVVLEAAARQMGGAIERRFDADGLTVEITALLPADPLLSA